LVIGLNDYPHFGSGGRSLQGAINDAEKFAAWLTDVDTGGGLPKKNCTLVTSKRRPLGPTQHKIDDALEKIKGKAAKAGGGRRLYFYFSGHGAARSTEDLALCMCHWSYERRQAAMNYPGYRRYIRDCAPFSELVFLLDCCRVRKTDVTGRTSELDCPKPRDDAGKTRLFIGYAATFQQEAKEAEFPRGSEDPDEGPIVHGYFTRALLAALRGGAAGPAGGVTASALATFLEDHVPRLAREHGHEQDVDVENNLARAREPEPIFGNALPEADFRILFTDRRRGEIQLVGPHHEVIRVGDATTGPWDVPLKQGLHMLIECQTGETHSFYFLPEDGVADVFF
jgi:hypothetical protein